jgi:hypothetical protein
VPRTATFSNLRTGKAGGMTPLRCAALAGLLLLPTAAVAAAGPARPPAHAVARTPQLTAEPSAVQPGEMLTLEGRGFPRNAHLALLAGPPGTEAERIGGAQTGRRGRFVATIRIRKPASAGPFVALACFDACRVKASARFRIVAP